MTNYKFGDVVLIGFPFTDLQSIKQRPAAVISNAAYQRQRQDVIFLAITSRISSPLQFGDQLIEHWQRAGLPKASALKPLIATIEHTRVIRRLGKLAVSDIERLQWVLRKILGYDPA